MPRTCPRGRAAGARPALGQVPSPSGVPPGRAPPGGSCHARRPLTAQRRSVAERSQRPPRTAGESGPSRRSSTPASRAAARPERCAAPDRHCGQRALQRVLVLHPSAHNRSASHTTAANTAGWARHRSAARLVISRRRSVSTAAGARTGNWGPAQELAPRTGDPPLAYPARSQQRDRQTPSPVTWGLLHRVQPTAILRPQACVQAQADLRVEQARHAS